MSFILTKENYHSREANQAYWSASQVKAFMDCPAAAMAALRGEWERPKSTALLVGSYVDAYFEGTLDLFRAQNPEIFKRDGSLKAEYVRAEEMILKAQQDALFMEFLRGEKQVIKTGYIFGLPFKIKMDVYLPDKRIVDLKTAADTEPKYLPEQGRVSFVEFWKWPLQMAIYQAVEGNSLPCYLNVLTKENPPDLAVIEIPQHYLDTEMSVLEEKLPYYDAVKRGLIEPERCEKCEYCRLTKKLTGVISLDDFTSL